MELNRGNIIKYNNTLYTVVAVVFKTAYLGFDDGAWHTGLDGKDVNTAVLLNEGWQTSGKFKDVPYFGYRKATHFIEKAVEEYRRSVQNPFNVKINKEY